MADAHRDVWAKTLTEQMAQLTGPIRHRQIEAASVEAVRKKWLATPSQPSLTSDPELFPLEDCGKGEEMKRVGYLNKEVRRLEDEGRHFWPMETPANWLKTRRRLTSLFSDFALSRNEKIKVWTGYRVASENIKMSLMEFGIPAAVRQCLAAGEPLHYHTHFINPVLPLGIRGSHS